MNKETGVAIFVDAQTAEQRVADLQREGITRVKVGGFDIDGVLRGKYISVAKFAAALSKGFGFCDVIFGWDMDDQLYDNAKLTGWDSGYPDTLAVIDTATHRNVPHEEGVAAFLVDFHTTPGSPHPACSRSLLKRVVSDASELGLTPKVGVELEFFMFQETRESIRDKQFRDLAPLDNGMMGYSWLRTTQEADLMHDLWEESRAFGIELEGLHTETGPGVYEVAITGGEAVAVADQAALFKALAKEIAHRHGVSVTFMAKFAQDLPGSSGHVHQSLWMDGKNAFHAPGRPHGMSELMCHYLSGQLSLMRELTAICSPTVNSYKRYVPGVWAPLGVAWGVENRTCALRVAAPGDPDGIRAEHRQPAADMNPYLAIASSLGAGLYGIKHKLSLCEETKGDAGSGAVALPGTLREAVRLLEQSEPAREIFGGEFVDHYRCSRDWEARQYERAVTDWERARYFELV